MEGEEPRWEELPAEVWQLVFQRVPLLDLITSGRSVCQRWNWIISDENVNTNIHKLYVNLYVKICRYSTEVYYTIIYGVSRNVCILS